MSTVGKYNSMIESIEQSIEMKNTIDDILDILTISGLWDKRVLAEIFKFMTGMSAVEYIKERQIMRAYRCLVEENGEISQAMDFTELANHSSFDKKFKARFSITPKEAKIIRDKRLYRAPLTWDVVTSGGYVKENIAMNESSAFRLKFGIEQDKLKKYNEAMEMQSLYGFSDEETEIAFDFATKNNIQMKKAFEYIDAGIEGLEMEEKEGGKSKEHWSKDEVFKITQYANMLWYICEHSSLPLKKADYLVFVIQDYVSDINKESIAGIVLFEKYMEKFFNYEEFKMAYEYFVNVGGNMEWWDDYVRYISAEIDYIEAFDAAKQEYEDFEEWMNSSYSGESDDRLF